MRLALVQAGDDALPARLTYLFNRVYAVGEEGLWRNGATRTTIAEVAGMIDAGEIAIATVGDQLAGAVREAAHAGVMWWLPEHTSAGS